MGDSRTFVLPESGGGANVLASIIPSILNQRGIDPGVLALMNGNNGWGNNGFMDLIVLLALFGGGGFGFGGGFGGNRFGGTPLLQSDANTAVILESVTRNGNSIDRIADLIGCSKGDVIGAINLLGSQMSNMNAAMGMNTNQIVTAVMQGDNNIISQLCSCCCDLKQLITQYGFENRIAISEQTNTLQNAVNNVGIGQERGFSNLGFLTQQQTTAFEKAINDSTDKILAGQRAAEMRELQRDLNAKDAKIAEQATEINTAKQTETFGKMLQNAFASLAAGQNELGSRLAKIECAQPETINVLKNRGVYIDPCTAAQYGFGPLGGFGVNNGVGFFG